MIKVRVLENRLPEVALSIRKAAIDSAQEASELGVQILQDDMAGPKSGRIYIIRGQLHQASAPGETPAVLSGELSASVGWRQVGLEAFEFFVGAVHAMILEFGSIWMAPRPFMKPTAALVGEALEEIAARLIGRAVQ